MEEKYQRFTGIVTGSHYNRELKAIRFILRFENGRENGFEWPITMFSFPEGCDKDEEMEKTAKIMRGKKISVKDIQD
jgi:hypothetical protein